MYLIVFLMFSLRCFIQADWVWMTVGWTFWCQHIPPPRGFAITLIGHITLGRTPLVEWSDRCRYLYLTKNSAHKRQTSIPWRNSNPHSQQASSHRPTLMPAYCVRFETWAVGKFSAKTLLIPSINTKIPQIFKKIFLVIGNLTC